MEPVSAAIMAGGALATSGMGYALDQKASAGQQDWLEDERDLAWKRSRRAYQSRYQDTVKDMRAAGLNPILLAPSVGGQPSAARAASAPDSSRGSRNVQAGVATGQAISQASQRKVMEILNRAQADQASTAAANARVHNQMLEEQLKFMRKHGGHMPGQINPSSVVGAGQSYGPRFLEWLKKQGKWMDFDMGDAFGNSASDKAWLKHLEEKRQEKLNAR